MADALRPLTLGELLDRTFFLYRKHAALFVGLVALPNLATLTLGLAFLPIQQQAQQQFQQQLQRPAGLGFPVVMALFGRMLAPMLVSLVVYLLVLAVSQGATVIAVSRLHLGREASISDSFVGIKGMVVTLCLIMIVVAIGVGLGTILLIVPGIL